MPQHQTFLHCSQTTALITFILIGTLFTIAGCSQLYKIIGLTEDQTTEQITKDQESKKQIIEDVRLNITQLITTLIAGAGTILSGFLAKWLNTEKKLTTVLIAGIEKAPNSNVKESVKTEALSSGVESILHTRVKALT